MIIQGLQKLTLLDFPGHTACTVFTAGCNLRCPFCHNASLVTHIDAPPAVTEGEFFDFLAKRQGILDGVAVTGGEPLLQRDLPDFLRRIRALGFKTKLDTNGTFPDRLAVILDEGLADYIAMDIKNSKEMYALTAGVEADILPSVERSLALLRNSGTDYELRTTVVAEFHTREDILAIGDWIRGSKRWFLQSFKDSGDTIVPGCSAMPDAELTDLCRELQGVCETVSTRGI